jgi:magnesium transporter
MRYSYPASGAPAGVSPRAFWIDLFEPTAEEVVAVEREYGLHLPTRAQLDEIENSSRLRVEGNTLYLSMPATAPFKEPDSAPSPIGFVLSPEVLVTLRYVELHSFARVRDGIAADARCTDSAAMFTMLLEALVDTDADYLERISAQLAQISRQVFRPQGGQAPRVARANRLLREMLVQVGDAGESLSRIRESLTALQRLSGFAADTQGVWLHQDIQTRLKTVRQDVNSLTDFESHLSGKVQFLLDAVLGFINTEQNEIFKVLTIASVVGIPPTFIASLYGMNFHNMPELSWTYGYAYGLGLIALSTILPIVWFKWRGWW